MQERLDGTRHILFQGEVLELAGRCARNIFAAPAKRVAGATPQERLPLSVVYCLYYRQILSVLHFTLSIRHYIINRYGVLDFVYCRRFVAYLQVCYMVQPIISSGS